MAINGKAETDTIKSGLSRARHSPVTSTMRRMRVWRGLYQARTVDGKHYTGACPRKATFSVVHVVLPGP
jgi:hypothetical protein